MYCYTVPYSHSRGELKATKWADSPEEALDAVKRVHRSAGLSSAVGPIEYGKAVLVQPQPFTPEARGEAPKHVTAVRTPAAASKDSSIELSFTLESPSAAGMQAAA